MALWKILVQYEGGSEHLRAVVPAVTARGAQSAAESMNFGGRTGTGFHVRVERADARPLGSVLVPANAGLTLDAGRAFRVDDRTVVLAPRVLLFDQVVAHLLRQPGPPPGWEPELPDLAQAAARVVFRWGFYMAALMDASKPMWPGATMGCSRFGDSEQARMNIELSANMEAWHRLATRKPAQLRHVAWAARSLPGPPDTDESRTAPHILDHLEGSDDEAQQNLLARLAAELPPEFAAKLDLTAQRLGQALKPGPADIAAFRLNPVRRIMNCVALATWRTPLEHFHGDQATVGDDARPARDPFTCRFTPREVAELEQGMAEAANGFAYTSDALQAWFPDDPWLARRMAKVAMMGEAGAKWTIMERSRACLL